MPLTLSELLAALMVGCTAFGSDLWLRGSELVDEVAGTRTGPTISRMVPYQSMDTNENTAISPDLAREVIALLWMLSETWDYDAPERRHLEQILEQVISETKVKPVFSVGVWAKAWSLIPEHRPTKQHPDDLNLSTDSKRLRQRLDFMDETIDSFLRREWPLDASTAAVAKDYLQRAREEFGRGNYESSHEFVTRAERVCAD